MSGWGFRVKYTYRIDRAEDEGRTDKDADEAGHSVERGQRPRVAVRRCDGTAIRRQLHNIAADELEGVFISGARGFERHRRRYK